MSGFIIISLLSRSHAHVECQITNNPRSLHPLRDIHFFPTNLSCTRSPWLATLERVSSGPFCFLVALVCMHDWHIISIADPTITIAATIIVVIISSSCSPRSNSPWFVVFPNLHSNLSVHQFNIVPAVQLAFFI